MASSISSLSYVNPIAYQVSPLTSAKSGPVSTSGVSATAELQEVQKQGNLQRFLNNSVAVAVLQPNAEDTGMAASTLVNNMSQQVLGAYQTQMKSTPGA